MSPLFTTLSDGSVVAVGEFSQEFCPSDRYNTPAIFSEGEANETTLIDYHLGDIFIAKYNPDGSLAWAKRAGGAGCDGVAGVTTCPDDSIVITGCYGSNCYGNLESATFGSGEPGSVTLYGTICYGSFYIAKYNSDGSLAWAKRAKGYSTYNNEYTQRGKDVVALSDGSVIATGVFANKAVFGEGEPNETALTFMPYFWDIFIAKYNSDGTLAWAKREGGSELEKPYTITARTDDSFIMAGGFGTSMVNPAIFGQGEPNQTILHTVGREDIFLASFDFDGTFQWADRAGSSKSDASHGICALSDGSVIACGSYGNAGAPGECPATFGEGQANETTLPHYGWDDIFIAKYEYDGTFAWAKNASGESQEIASDITVMSDDTFAITGEFWESCTFDEGLPTEITITPYPDSDPNFSYDDIFVAWFNTDGAIDCASTAGGRSYDCSYGITSLDDGSVVATGDVSSYGGVFGKGEENETWVFGQIYVLFVAKWSK